MARTHKADRLFQAKLDGIRYSIRVLQAVEEFIESKKYAVTEKEKDYFKAILALKHNVKAYDITQALLRY